MDFSISSEEIIEEARQQIVSNLSLGKVYNIRKDEFFERNLITSSELLSICEFGLKVATGNASLAFLEFVQERKKNALLAIAKKEAAVQPQNQADANASAT